MKTLQEQAAELLPIVQALSEGKEVEYKQQGSPTLEYLGLIERPWSTLTELYLVGSREYRIVNAEPKPKPLKLEEGKRYVRRDESITEPLGYYGDLYDYPFHDYENSYTKEGGYLLDYGTSPYDLISEYKP